MMNWDFQHIANQRTRQIQNSVKLSTYEEQYHFPRRRVGINPWLCIAVIVGCAWLLWKVVVG